MKLTKHIISILLGILFITILLNVSKKVILAAPLCSGLTSGPLKTADGKGVLFLGDSLSACEYCFTAGLGTVQAQGGKRADSVAREVQSIDANQFGAVVVFLGINDLVSGSSAESVSSSLRSIYTAFSSKGIPVIGVTLVHNKPTPTLASAINSVNNTIKSTATKTISLESIVSGSFPENDPVHFLPERHTVLRQAVRDAFGSSCGAVPTPQISTDINESPEDSSKQVVPPNATGKTALPYLADFAKNCKSDKGITCVMEEFALNLLGSIKPAENILNLPFIKDIVASWENINPHMTPLALLPEKTIPLVQEYTASGTLQAENETGTRCYSVQNGIITAKFPFLNNLIAETTQANALAGMLGRREDFNFKRDFRPQTLTEKLTRGCIDPTKGIETSVTQEKSLGEHAYAPDDNPFVTAVKKLGANRVSLLNSIISQLGFAKGESAAANVGVYAFLHTLCPHCNFISEQYASDESGKRTGLVASLIPLDRPVVYSAANEEQPLETTIGDASNVTIKNPFSGLGGPIEAHKDLYCAMIPTSMQDGRDCSPKERQNNLDPGTIYSSTWVMEKQSGIRSPVKGPFKDILKKAATDEKIPQCVLEAVAFAEGGDLLPELSKDQCIPNVCSAAGSMQFTTGIGPANDPQCKTCDAGYCPNTWKSYGNNGNPCNWYDALSAAARKLKNDGPLLGTDPAGQGEAIHKAGYHYYGSDNNKLARDRFGGCEYGEFLRKTCEPSYVCRLNR
ncbi:MAG: SGNH/GDSL hydrolase family protein [Patescibacteria group bacterium]